MEPDAAHHTYACDTPITVRFAETDAQGIVHNSNYLVWYEVARIDYIERFMGGYASIRERGVEALTTETHVRYLKPALFDDRLVVRSRIRHARGARFRFEYAIERDDELIADGWTLHAFVDGTTLRPIRLPDWFGEAVARVEPEY